MNPAASTSRAWLPFFVEFVKFASGFAFIVMVALIALRFASVAAGA